jgi:predicted polyphosphate/ATP-dependent NAD kinase
VKQIAIAEALGALYGLGLTKGYEEFTRLARKFKLGLIVNPIAGMGGRVGLKGTDSEVLEKAISMGAKPVAPLRAVETLKALSSLKDALELITYPKEMGEYEALEAGFKPLIVGSLISNKTTAEDTKRAAGQMSEIPVNLLLFAGGDGTARDISIGLKCNIPVLGIPAGVKMYSSVFAVNPKAAARLITIFIRRGLPLSMAEVMDIDEEEFRNGRLLARLCGHLLTPYEPDLVQSRKIASQNEELENQIEIAKYVSENMKKELVYILGPGSSVYALGRILGIEKSLLGVDIVHDGKLIAKDANEDRILSAIKNKDAKIIITPVGGQGFIFGRGNQQISPRVIRKVGRENILVICTRSKLHKIGKLRVDTGELNLDEELKGCIRVVTGYREERMIEVI